jgi:hypothetical protein
VARAIKNERTATVAEVMRAFRKGGHRPSANVARVATAKRMEKKVLIPLQDTLPIR